MDVKRKGIDILFAIDTSRSMLAEDIRPNRLERSKYAILDFVNQLQGDRVGLLPFAGSAYLMCPLTIDYAAFEQSLKAVDTQIIPTHGTNIAETIYYSETVLNNNANHKLLIIITDGENLDGDVEKAARSASENKMTIFTVGVGTAKGELIPIKSKSGSSFVKDQSGKFVTSRLDDKMLSEISQMTGGMYVPLGSRGEGLEAIYRQKLALIPKEDLMEKRQKVPIERLSWPLGLALFLLLLEFLISERKSGQKRRFLSRWGKRFLLIFILILTYSDRGMASPGEEAYESSDFLTASEYYLDKLKSDPRNPILLYNYGTAAYQNNLFEEAISAFSKSLESDDIHLQEKAYYNRGNAQFRRGQESLQSEPQKTMEQWQNAVDSYSSSLKISPQNQRAQVNLDYVEKKLEELKKQMENKSKDSEQKDSGAKKKNKEQNENNEPQDNSSQEDKNNSDGEQSQAPSQKNQDRQQDKQQDIEEGQEKPSPSDTDETTPDKGEVEQINSDNTAGSPAQENGKGQNRMIEKMSREEAVQLLNELKNEEGKLMATP